MHILPTRQHAEAPANDTVRTTPKSRYAMHQKLGLAADDVDHAIQAGVRETIVSGKFQRWPKTVLTVAATAFATSFASSAGRHAALRLCTLVCAQGVNRLGLSIERGISTVGNKIGPNKHNSQGVAPALPTHTEARQSGQRPLLNRLKDSFHSPVPAPVPAARSVSQKVGYAVASPVYALNEVIALGLTFGAIMVGASVGLVAFLGMGLASALVIMAVAHEKPDTFIWLVANGLRTGFKVFDEVDHMRGYLQLKQNSQSSGKKRVMRAVIEPSPSVDEALDSLLTSLQRKDGPEVVAAVEEDMDQLAKAVANLPALADILGVRLVTGQAAQAVVSQQKRLQHTPAQLFSTATLAQSSVPTA